MSKYVIEDTTLNNTANAIREKTGKTDKITPSNFATEIASIVSGGESSSGIKIEVQSYRPTSNETSHEFTHNLGVVPDRIEIYVHCDTLYTAKSKVIYYANGLRNQVLSLGYSRYCLQNCFFKNTDSEKTLSDNACACIYNWDIDITSESGSKSAVICGANSQKFNFNGTTAGLCLGEGLNYLIILMSGVNE